VVFIEKGAYSTLVGPEGADVEQVLSRHLITATKVEEVVFTLASPVFFGAHVGVAWGALGEVVGRSCQSEGKERECKDGDGLHFGFGDLREN